MSLEVGVRGTAVNASMLSGYMPMTKIQYVSFKATEHLPTNIKQGCNQNIRPARRISKDDSAKAK